MKIKSVPKPKHAAWAIGALVGAIIVNLIAHSGAKASVQTPSSPLVEVATVEQKDVPVYGEWIGTLAGQVNADVKAQVSGYLLTRKYKEGSYVRKGQLLFEIDASSASGTTHRHNVGHRWRIEAGRPCGRRRPAKSQAGNDGANQAI